MSEETKAAPAAVDEAQDATQGAVGAEGAATAGAEEASSSPSPKKRDARRRKRFVTLGVVAAVVIVAGAGFWVWHEQPSFCNAICHAPQDPHSQTYFAESGQSALDKWGNYVEDAGDMLVVAHREKGDLGCMDCHVPTISEQVAEGMNWVGGNYNYPLNERSMTDLNHYAQKDDPAEFCLNESCHNMTRDDLARATAGSVRNPHVTEVRHVQMECSDCHKSHRQSVQACSRCHADAEVPDGWLSAEEAAEVTSANFDF